MLFSELINFDWLDFARPFAVSFLVVLALTPIIIRLANRFGWFATPGGRKIHTQPIPQLGGIAIILSLVFSVLFFVPTDKHVLGLMIGLAIIFVTGLIDDLYEIRPIWKLFGQALAAVTVILFGVGIEAIANPFGEVIRLDGWQFDVVSIGGLDYQLTVWADLFTFIWLMVIMNAMNFLDGLDGLASGVSGIAGITLFVLSLFVIVGQPTTATLAIILAGAALAFLVFNFHPAKIFLGDSGSLSLGFTIGVLAIISGGKVATALLVLGLPILDFFYSIARRIVAHKPIYIGDKEHLHHLLLDVGLTQRRAVFLFYALTAGFGIIALMAGSFDKLIGLGILGVVMVILVYILKNFRR